MGTTCMRVEPAAELNVLRLCLLTGRESRELYLSTANGALMDLPSSRNHSTTSPTPCMLDMLSTLADVIVGLAAHTEAQCMPKTMHNSSAGFPLPAEPSCRTYLNEGAPWRAVVHVYA